MDIQETIRMAEKADEKNRKVLEAWSEREESWKNKKVHKEDLETNKERSHNFVEDWHYLLSGRGDVIAMNYIGHLALDWSPASYYT